MERLTGIFDQHIVQSETENETLHSTVIFWRRYPCKLLMENISALPNHLSKIAWNIANCGNHIMIHWIAKHSVRQTRELDRNHMDTFVLILGEDTPLFFVLISPSWLLLLRNQIISVRDEPTMLRK
jgi:hypothetical protein